MTGTVLDTPAAIEWYRMNVLLSALRLEKVGIRAHRAYKASILVKDELNKASVYYKNKLITRKSHIPLDVLETTYAGYLNEFARLNEVDIRKGVKNY